MGRPDTADVEWEPCIGAQRDDHQGVRLNRLRSVFLGLFAAGDGAPLESRDHGPIPVSAGCPVPLEHPGDLRILGHVKDGSYVRRSLLWPRRRLQASSQ